MADNDRSNLISEFCKVTGVDAVRAQHYLEASGWDHNLAVYNYFEEGEDSESAAPNMFPRPGSPKPKPKPKQPKLPSSGGARITTFANLRQNEESDEEEGQAFYAGGSERSGQQILGPNKRKAVNEIVQDMFKAVRTFGAEEAADHSKKCAGGSKAKAFRGTGYVLGSTPQCSDPVPGEEASEGASEPLDICLRLWQTGFTVDDGPLREYNDPQNRDFLTTVRKGEIPMELRHKANGGEVHVKLEDHSHEEYVPKKPQVQAFAGTGFRLGNVTPTVTSPPSEQSQKTNEDAQKSIGIDDSKPVTNLQIRLADGSRLTMQANHNHTVGAVRRFIVEARPEYASLLFSLLSSFPPKELVDDNATLEEENLINAVIVQKLKK